MIVFSRDTLAIDEGQIGEGVGEPNNKIIINNSNYY